jgi:hypothetical protein
MITQQEIQMKGSKRSDTYSISLFLDICMCILYVVWVDVLLWKFWVLHTFCVGDCKNNIYIEKSIVLYLFTCRCTETESEKSTKCFPSSESTDSLSSETSISCQPIQQRSTCMIHSHLHKMYAILKIFTIKHLLTLLH